MSTTYHIWHNGQDHGPYTAIEMRGMLARGELVGVLWRRTGGADYRPHTELADELTQQESAEPSIAPSATSRTRGKPAPGQAEPSGWSIMGFAFGALGGICCASGLVLLFIVPPLGGAALSAGLVLLGMGVLFDIHAKLALIAHRLQR